MINLWLTSSDWIIFGTLLFVFGGNAYLLHRLCFSAKTRTFILSFNGVVAPFFVMAATIFAFTTALLGGSVWQSFHENAQAIKTEGENLFIFIEMNEAIPKIKQYNLAQLAKNYAKSAVESEWELIKSNKKSAKTEAEFIKLLTTTIDAASQPDIPIVVGNALIRSIDAVAQARATRLSLLHSKTERARWLCVFLLALLTQLAVAAVHLDKPRPNALALWITTITIVVSLGLIALADSPHSIKESISIEPLKAIIKN